MVNPIKHWKRSRLWRRRHGLSVAQAAAILDMQESSIRNTHDRQDRLSKQALRIMRCVDLMTPEQKRQLLDEVMP